MLTLHRFKRIAALLLFLLAGGALQAEYPERYVRVIVHYPAGGSTDIMARLLTSYLSRSFDVPFVVQNYTGAGGQVGYFTLATAKPDGYTIGTITTTSILTHELTRKKVPYKFHDSFIPVAQIVEDPAGLFVSKDSPFHSLEDLLQSARERPGKINLGGTSLWGTHHVHVKLIEKECGVALKYIPFDGGAEARNNLLGNHIDTVSDGVSGFYSLVEAGKVRILAVAATHRLPRLPDTPTYRELGYNIVLGSSRGFAVPAGTPQRIVDHLVETIQTVIVDPAFLADAERMNIKPSLKYRSSADYQNDLNELYVKLVKMVGESHGRGK